MKFLLQHQTHYRYDREVSLSLQTLRLTPRQPVRRESIRVEPGGNLRAATDVFENRVLIYEYLGSLREWSICNELELDVEPFNTFDFLVEPEAMVLPFSYGPAEQAVLAPALSDERMGEEFSFLCPETDQTVDFLVGLNAAIHRHFVYRERHEPGVQTVGETLQLGSGSCRDFAVLLATLVRSRGLAARLVSGYLLVPTGTTPQSGECDARHGATSMHAWVEIYVPGAGWRGFDPTNGILADHLYLPCAVGLETAQIAPVLGHYYSNATVSSRFSFTLSIVRH